MVASGRMAVVLFNLGGPDNLEAVESYLTNLFSDPAILGVPNFIRPWLARLIAKRRAPFAREIFAELGGGSPILAETKAQAEALDRALASAGAGEACVFIAMRYWHPRANEVARAVVAFAPERTILLPLYPQFSTATTASSLAEFERALAAVGHTGKVERVCCYPTAPGLVSGFAAQIGPAVEEAQKLGPPRILFSAHGLPERIVRRGDPYVWQVEETAKAVFAALRRPALEWSICYQSRVGPLKWTGPSIDEALAKTVKDGRVPVLVPIAFVSEHSETLVELDIKYREMARGLGALGYVRVSALGVSPDFISALAALVRRAADHANSRAYCNARICPRSLRACPNTLP